MKNKIIYLILIASIVFWINFTADIKWCTGGELNTKQILYKNFSPPSNGEINDVIEAVIYQDSLRVIKTKPFFQYLIYSHLFYNKVEFKSDTSDIFDITLLNLKSVLNNYSNSECFFASIDSLYLIYQSDFQNNNKTVYHINSKLLNKLYVVEEIVDSLNNEKETQRRSLGNLNFNIGNDYHTYLKAMKKFDYVLYTFKIPLFSLDKNKVYIELWGRYFTDCVTINAYYLEKDKQNGSWKIMKKKFLGTLGMC